jgi:ketosteroid isomerase-like protein
VPDAGEIAMAFHAAVNARDLERLTAMMTEDHRFVDMADVVIAGREACHRAWRDFFRAFRDYRNEITDCVVAGNSAAMSGRTHCSNSMLEGPALWTAIAVDDRLSEWRVYHDTPENRAALGLPT